MAEPGRGSLRLGAVLALAVVALFDVLAVAHGIRSQRRLRARVSEAAERRVEAARSSLDPVLARGREAWDEAAQLAIALGLASEVEVIGPEGQVAFSRPHVAPVVHQLREADRRQLEVGRTVTALARDGQALRALTYVPLPVPSGGHVLRLAVAGARPRGRGPRVADGAARARGGARGARAGGGAGGVAQPAPPPRRPPRACSRRTRRRWAGCATGARS